MKQRYKTNSKMAYLSFFRGFRRCIKKGKLAEHPQIYENFLLRTEPNDWLIKLVQCALTNQDDVAVFSAYEIRNNN